MTRIILNSSLLVAVLAACDKPQWIPPDLSCPSALRPVWMADPHYALCVSTSFRTTDLRTWQRALEGQPADQITVQPDVGQTQIDLTGGWPPRLKTTEATPAAQGIVLRVDSTNGVISHTEVGARDQKDTTSVVNFVSGIRAPDGRYMLASGQTASMATLDTLLLMFRTISRVHTPDPNRRSR